MSKTKKDNAVWFDGTVEPAPFAAEGENCASLNQEIPVSNPPFAKDGKDLPSVIWKLAWPVISENLLITMLFLVDTWMVSLLGSASLAASGIGGVLLWRVFMLTGCIDRGVSAMVARAVGEGDINRASHAAAQGLLSAVVIGIPLTVIGVWLSADFLRWMGADKEVVDVGTVFMQAIFLSSLMRLLQVVASGILRAAGDTKTPMWIMVGTNIVNLFLNWVLIFGHLGCPALGLTGSGIATSISVVGSSIITVAVLWKSGSLFRIKLRHFVPDMRRQQILIKLSIPVLFDEIMVSAGFLTFYGMINTFGTIAMAAHTISVRIEGLSYNVGAGFLVAGATLMGQALGAYGPKEAAMAVRAVVIRAFFILSAIAVFLLVFPEWLVAQFNPASDVHYLATAILILSATAQPFMAVSYVFTGGLRGAGDTVTPMYISIFTNLFMRIGMSWFLAFQTGLGLWGLYITVTLEWTVRALWLSFAYRRGRWKNIDLK